MTEGSGYQRGRSAPTRSWPCLTPAQQRALARLIHELRPDWDVPGIERFIGQAAMDRPSGPDLAVATIRAASSATNRTPAIIPLDGAHWRAGDSIAPPPAHRAPTRDELCRHCGKDERTCTDLGIKLGHVHGHRFTPLSAPPTLDVETGQVHERMDPERRRALLAAARAARQTTTSPTEPGAPSAGPPTPIPEPATTTQGAAP